MWMNCVPYSLSELDVFALGIIGLTNFDMLYLTVLDFHCKQQKFDIIIAGSSLILDGDVQLALNVDWNIDALCSDFANWMSDDSSVPASISSAGILSCLSFERVFGDMLHKDLARNVRLLVQITSFLHNHGLRATYAGYSSMDLWSIRSYAGSNVLRNLERALCAPNLSKLSENELKTLFLVLFGATLGVGYSKSVHQTEDVRILNPD